MRLMLITNDNLRDFEDHLPDAYTGRPELLGVACIEETEDEDVILGTAVVSPNEEEDRLEVQWMYVEPEHRRKGAGSLMLKGIRDMAKAAGLRLVDVCFPGEDIEEEESDDWTFDPAEEPDDRWDASDDSGEDENTEIEILKQFLQAKEFLTMSEYPICSFQLSDVIHSDFVKKHEKNRNNRIMADYEGISWKDITETMRRSVREKVTQAGFSDLTYLCSPDLSFVCVKGGKIIGCLLAEDDPEEKMIKVQLFIDFAEDPICSAKLIVVAGDRVLSSYPEDYHVSFIALNESSRKLLGTILDDEKKLRQDGYTVRAILEA